MVAFTGASFAAAAGRKVKKVASTTKVRELGAEVGVTATAGEAADASPLAEGAV